MDKRQQRKLIGMVMAFMLALGLFSLGVVLIMKFSVFHEPFLLRTMEESGYYSIAHRNIEENIGYRATPFDIPEEVLEGLIGEDRVRIDARGYLSANLRREGYQADLSELEAVLDERIRQYLVEENIPIEEAQEEAIDEFTSLALQEYRMRTEIPFAGTVGSVTRVFDRYFFILLGGALLFSGFFGGVLVKLLRHKRFYRYFGFGFSGAGLLLLTLPVVLFVVRPYQRLNLAPESFYHYVMELISSTLLLVILIALAMIILSLPLYIFDWRIRNEMRKREHV